MISSKLELSFYMGLGKSLGKISIVFISICLLAATEVGSISSSEKRIGKPFATGAVTNVLGVSDLAQETTQTRTDVGYITSEFSNLISIPVTVPEDKLPEDLKPTPEPTPTPEPEPQPEPTPQPQPSPTPTPEPQLEPTPEPVTPSYTQSIYNAGQYYVASNATLAKQKAQEINFIPSSNYESASNMCGPLAGAILYRAGLLSSYPAAQWWLPTPDRLSGLTPGWQRFDTRTSTRVYNFNNDPLHVGDLLYLQGCKFDHVIAVTRIDEQGRAYSVNNYSHVQKGFIIEELMLYDPACPNCGILRTWPVSSFSCTGTAGFSRWRKPGLQAANLSNQKLNLLTGLVAGASAQSNEVTKPVNGELDITETGRYSFFMGEDKIAEENVVVQKDKVTISMYYDLNGNKQKDPDEKYLDDSTDIKVKKESKLLTYELVSGWNSISLPMDVSNGGTIATAKQLLDYWNKQGAEIIHVARFSGGAFQIFSKRGEGFEFNEDFQIIPGQGLFIFNNSPKLQVIIPGREFTDPVSINALQGWNLVGIVAPGRSYTSETLINKMEAAGIKADTVSQFENGLYKSQVKEEGTLFGNSFKIIDKRGYFVRVDEGGGQKFTP